jgi:hypothetical protein
MKPQHDHNAHVTADIRRVTPGDPDPDAALILLAEVNNGALGWHRAGYVTLDDGLTRAPEMVAWHLTLMRGKGYVAFGEASALGDRPVEITLRGLAHRADLLTIRFGVFVDAPTDPTLPACESGEVA